MNKIYLFIVVALTVFLTLLGFDARIQTSLDESVRSIKAMFVDTTLYFENFTKTYYNQADHIQELSKKLQDETRQNLILTQEINKLRHDNSAKLKVDLNRTIDSNKSDTKDAKGVKSYTLKLNGKLEPVKVLSYVNFKDFSKVYLDFTDSNNKVRGLIYDNHAAGIVVFNDKIPIALLNTNEKCGYSVSIGPTKIPGVTSGLKHTNKLVVKYIPVWLSVKVGDEVITSGMDGIFFEGLKVGRVLEVQRQPMFQEAIVEPNQEALSQRAYLMYTTN